MGCDFTQLGEAADRGVYIRTVLPMLSPRFRSLFALLLAFAPTLSTAVARAAPEPTASELSVARRLFEEAKAAEDAGRFREAAEKFRKAIAIKDTPGMRFHLARCEEEQGAFVEALLEYDRARELLEGGTKAVDVEKLLPSARQRVKEKLAQLTLRLPEGVSNATVELDGKALSGSVLGVPIPMNPGRHRLRAAASGRADYVSELELGTGESKQVAIELPPAGARAAALPAPAPAAPVQPAPAPAAQKGSSNPARTVALVSEASLFAAGLTSGIVFTIAKSGANDRYQTANERVLSQVGGSDPSGTACAVPREGCAELENARGERDRDGAIATAGFVTAGVSALAFGLTLGLWKTRPPAQVHAQVQPNRLAVSVSGAF